eukprot:jgi/Ulvmu1/9920/UM058_0002.1
MGRGLTEALLEAEIYSCSTCRADIADHSDIISKAFQGRYGRAFLFNGVTNIAIGPKEERLLITGLHTVADIQCACCGTVLGWKYVTAYEDSQKYKEGKYIIEKARVMKKGEWE